MICGGCGKEIQDKWNKCPFCGGEVPKTVVPQEVIMDEQVEKIEEPTEKQEELTEKQQESTEKKEETISDKLAKSNKKFRAFRLKLAIVLFVIYLVVNLISALFGEEESEIDTSSDMSTEEVLEEPEEVIEELEEIIEESSDIVDEEESFVWESGVYWTDTSEGVGRISITKSTEGTNLAFIEMGTDEYVDLMRVIEGIQIDDKTVVATWNEAVFTIVWDTETTFTITREGSCTDANDLADMDYLTDGQQYTLEGTGEETEDVAEDTRDFTNINADDYTTQELLEIYKEITPITDANTSSIVGRTYVNSVDESMLQVVEVTGSTVILLTSYVYTDAFDSADELVAIDSSSFENGWQTFSVSDDGLIIEVVMFTEAYGEETLEYVLMDEAYDKDTVHAALDTSLFETSIFTNTYYNETYNLRLKIVEGTYDREGLTGIVIEVTNLNYDDDSYTLSLVISDSSTARDADGRFLILSDDASALRYYNIGTALEYPNEVVYYAE